MNTGINWRTELKLWGIYFATILVSILLHELGHCIVAWTQGYAAIPTPAKAYLLQPIPTALNNYFSLGGIIGSILFPLVTLSIFLRSSFTFSLPLFAGGLAMPGMYSLRFMLAGRGHDGNEFQEAQEALGVGYSGHFLDGLFLALFITSVLIWVIKCRPTYKIAGRIIIGIVLTFIFVVQVQKLNNLIFDPYFSG